MKKAITFIICTLLMFGLVSAQDLQKDAGITPDSPLYGLDKALEQLRYRLTFFNAESRANYGILIAEERLAEIQEMSKQGLNNSIQFAEQERQRILNRLEIDSSQLKTEARQRIQEKLQLHISNEEKIREQLTSLIQDKIGDSKELLSKIKKQLIKNGFEE